MIKLYLSILLVAAFTPSLAQTYSVDNAYAEVKGKTSLTSYTGVSNALKGTVDLNSMEVSFEIPLNTIDTDNNLRNKHMREALETSDHPEAEFAGKIISSFNEDKQKAQMVKVKGNFSIHGKAKPLEVNATLTPSEKGIRFFATWPVNITDFEIERPSMMFMKVDDKHVISIKGTLQKRSAF